jgi:hypothetical protein
VSEPAVFEGGGHQKWRALFLMHNYNDIDHMTPVIHALCASRRWRCAVLSYPLATQGSVDFDRDWRFAHVRATHGVEVDRVERVAPGVRGLIRLYQFRETLTRWCDKTPPLGRLFGRDLRGLLPWFLAWRYYDRFLAFWLTRVTGLGRQLLARYRPDVIAVDWGRSHGIMAGLLAVAARRGIRILQLPHGAWTYEGIYSHESQFNPAKLHKRIRLPIIPPDAMVVDNVYKVLRSIAQGVSRDRLRLLGLARFTPQWHAVLASLPKGTASLASTGRPRVVWFPTWLMASKLEAVDATLAVLEEFADRLDIVLKVHTRNPANEQADYGRRLKPGSRIRLVGNEEESFAVTRWADLVLVTQSSIVYDAFLMGKPVIYLKYTHNFECIWEADGAGDTVRDAAALRARIAALADGRYRPGYSAETVARFLRSSVAGGLDPAEVLPAHVTLFEQAARRQPLTVGADADQGVAAWERAGRTIVRPQLDAAGRPGPS